MQTNNTKSKYDLEQMDDAAEFGVQRMPKKSKSQQKPNDRHHDRRNRHEQKRSWN